jgi:phosphohistidine phosphatase
MQLLLIRHGIAAPQDDAHFPDDAARPLTPRGIRRVRRIAVALNRLRIRLDEVWTSPLLRAEQTAELLAAAQKPALRPRRVDALSPYGDFETLVQALRSGGHPSSLALVGHEPYLGRFTSYLLSGTSAIAITYKKGGVGCVEIDQFDHPLRGRLEWLMTPRQLLSVKKNRKPIR